MKKLLAIFLSFVLAISCLSVGAIADTTVREVETNETLATATLFTDTITGTLSARNDVDYYKINVTGDCFTVNVKINSAFAGTDVGYGWDVFVYDAEGTQLLKIAEVKTDSTTMRLAFKGLIYVKIVSASSNSYPAADYDLTVAQTVNPYWEKEQNENATSATQIATNATYTGSLYKRNDTDFYKVNVTGNYFTLNFKVNSAFAGADVGYGWDVYLYDSSMKQILKYSDLKSEKTSVRLGCKGLFYIKVVSASANSYPTAEYDLTITQTVNPYWESESNDELKTANSIAVGKAYTGSLISKNDVDCYKAYVTGDYFVVNFAISNEYLGADLGNGWNAEIYNNLGELVYTIKGITANTSSVKLAYSGNVYIKIVPYSTYYCPSNIEYKLSVAQTVNSKWETENANDSIKKSDSLKHSSYRQGTLLSRTDVDYYKISIPTSGTVKLSFSRTLDENDGNGYKVEFKNSAGTTIKSIIVDGTLKGSMSGLKVSKGTYYVSVSAASSYSAPNAEIVYKVSHTFKPSKPTLKKVTAAKKAVKVSWKQAKYVDGYQIQYATAKSFKKAKTTTVKKYKTTSKTIKKLKAKKTYYVRIRTFKKVDGKKVYSSWSKVKKAKTKK